MPPIPGVGPQYPQPDPRGWLVFTALPTGLQDAEDATRAADYERAHAGLYGFDRPATDAEIALLTHLGHEITDPDNLTTTITYISTGVRNRRWLPLESLEES